MVEFIQHPVVQALAWTLVHFLWQGAAIGLAAWVAFRAVRTSASARYAVGVGALAAMLAAPAATFLTILNRPAPLALPAPAGPAAVDPSTAVSTTLASVAGGQTAAAAPVIRVSPEALAVAVLAWLAGVTGFSIRLLGGWIVARRMARRAVRPASDGIQALARQLAARLRVDRAVLVLESSAIAVPVMVGWLKPAVVLPMAALGGLSPAQMEAVLAHELAHVRRHDYLVNLLQSVAEALLFYHPAVWWLSRHVRALRELCCDDIAVGVCDRVVYATALTDLAALTSPRVALAATDGDLIGRVRRILGQSEAAPVVRAGVMPVLALALVAGVAVSAAFASASDQNVPKTSAISQSVEPDAAPPETTVMPAREAPSRVESGRPTEPALDGQIAEQTAAQQAERQKQIEEARQEDIRRNLEQLAAQLKSQVNVRDSDQMKAYLVQLAEQRKALDAVRTDQIAVAQRQLEDAKRRFEAGLATEQQVRELEQALKQLQAATLTQELGSRDLREAERALARVKELFDKGLVSEQQVRQAEAALANARAQGNAELVFDVQLKEARANLERARAMVEKGLMTPRDVADLEARAQALEQRARDLRAQVQVREVRPEPTDADRARAAERNLVAVVDAAELVRAGDVLRIIIDGEPDLPNSFQVSPEGTIRMPFLGPIKVVGLTSANVRAAIGKQLSDRKLGSAAQVKVTLLRVSRGR